MSRPEFAENVRARLVNPRRNVDRALNHVRLGRKQDAIFSLIQVVDGLTALSEYVDRENERHEHTCSCGHVHYVQGDDAS